MFGISNTSAVMWLNGVRQNRETDEEHDEDCVQDGFQEARVKFLQRGRGILGMGNRSISV